VQNVLFARASDAIHDQGFRDARGQVLVINARARLAQKLQHLGMVHLDACVA
jgi:hypothetical protein